MGTGSTVCTIQTDIYGTWRLRAAKAVPTTTVAPQFCQWTCSCGAGPETFRIDGATDGLPVELLEYDIIDGGNAIK